MDMQDRSFKCVTSDNSNVSWNQTWSSKCSMNLIMHGRKESGQDCSCDWHSLFAQGSGDPPGH